MAIQPQVAYKFYVDRFARIFGDVADDKNINFLDHSIRKLSRAEFDGCLQRYLDVHAACKAMIDTGATIHDAAIQELREAAAWIAIEPPDLLAMFKGELGDPQKLITSSVALPLR